MKGFRKCAECGDVFSLEFRNTNSKFCDDNCRAAVRKKVQKNNRENRANKLKGLDKDYICNEIYLKYKQIAPKRKLIFDLTIETFKKYFRSTCYYCGENMINVGFDRVDNSIGYVESNIVPCCTTCNLMKRAMDKDFFLNHCRKIADHKK